MEQSTNVVISTNMPNLFERLEALQGQLTLCEKALAEYLETKRLAFPRFYFVSSADLLDILSNGNQPKVVMRHLTKLFDSMAKLKFKQDAQGEDIKASITSYLLYMQTMNTFERHKFISNFFVGCSLDVVQGRRVR